MSATMISSFIFSQSTAHFNLDRRKCVPTFHARPSGVNGQKESVVSWGFRPGGKEGIATRISRYLGNDDGILASPPTTKVDSKPLYYSSKDDKDETLELKQQTWMFRNKYPIAYEIASTSDSSDQVEEAVPVLLLNGFGVGSFHQHRLMRQLLLEHQECQRKNSLEAKSARKRQYIIYGIDYLGQGKSWPSDCNDGNSQDELNLGYSADMWIDQIVGFINDIILSSDAKKKVHIVGNSVGGYLATILTHRYPHLISSLTLLNATPVWGLNLPFWDGKLPAPSVPKFVGRQLFDIIRDLDVIDKYLDVAYVHRGAFDGSFDDSFRGSDMLLDNESKAALGGKIRGCTEGNGGHAAFASILWSPPASKVPDTDESSLSPMGFYDALVEIPVDVLLLFGSSDQWCTPAVAKRIHSTLFRRQNSESASENPAQRYVALDNIGHCPNHESPTAVAMVLHSWLEAPSAASPSEKLICRSTVPLVPTESISGSAQIREPWGNVTVREVSVTESENLGFMDWVVSRMVG